MKISTDQILQEMLQKFGWLQEDYNRYEQVRLQEVLNYSLGHREKLLIRLFISRDIVTIKNVTAYLSVPNSTVTSLVNRLEASGIIERRLNIKDRRVYELRLTEDGLRIKDILITIRLEWFKRLTKSFNLKDYERTSIALTKMMEQVQTYFTESSRRYTMDRLKMEYDRFGPWIIEIKEASEIPPQFDREKERILEAAKAYKIPVNIERRKLKPGMPMYDFVIALHEEYLDVMERHEGVVTLASINYSDVQILEKVNDLLNGHIFIYAGQREYSVPYNPVSDDLIDEMMDFMRERFVDKERILDLDKIKGIDTIETALYRNLLNDFKKKEQVIPLQYQPFMELKHLNSNTWTKLLDLIEKPVLQDSLFLTNGYELMVFTRVKEVKKSSETDYGYRQLFIPLGLIADVSIVNDEVMDELVQLEIVVGSIKKEILVSKELNVDYIKELVV